MKKNFITGFAILLPLIITIAVIIFIVNLLTKPFMGIVSELLSNWGIVNRGFLFLSPEQALRYGSQLLILFCLFLVTLLIGIVARFFIVKSLFHIGDRLISRIPLVNTVYQTTQDIIKTLFVSDKGSFKQVVLVPFPNPGSYVLGLISRESPVSCSRSADQELISVLVPTTPNPTTGFLLMLPKKDLIFVSMRPEDAIKYIVSCGVVIPQDSPLMASILPKK
jgi:uncharacterized membrane protein